MTAKTALRVAAPDRRRQPAASTADRAISRHDSPGLARRLENRVGKRELLRRAWHISPGLLPFVLWFAPHADPISPTLRLAVLLVGGLVAARIFFGYRRIARRDDTQRSVAVAGYAGCVLATVFLFPQHLELGLTVLAVLAFGDGSATLFGKFVGGPRLPFNRGKTWSGLVAFLAVGTAAATAVYWGETNMNPEARGFGSISPLTALLVAAPTVLAAALAESLPSRINDNVRVGLASSATVIAMHGGLVGWIG